MFGPSRFFVGLLKLEPVSEVGMLVPAVALLIAASPMIKEQPLVTSTDL